MDGRRKRRIYRCMRREIPRVIAVPKRYASFQQGGEIRTNVPAGTPMSGAPPIGIT